MTGRQGGKAKPLKAPKKEKKEDDDEDKAHFCFHECIPRRRRLIPNGYRPSKRDRKQAAERKAMAERAKKGGPLGSGGGIKKSGKK